MALSSLRMRPEVGAVDSLVTLVPVGTPVGQERRFYVAIAPPSSKLVTLATYEDLGLKLADARLKAAGDNQATFTPDVPGQYAVAVRDVVVYRFQPHYDGHVPATGDPREADNEEASFTVDGDTTAQAATVLAVFYVRQTLSRTIGFGQDTATLALQVYGDVVADHELVDGVATLTAGATAPAKVAIYDDDVQAVLARIEELNDPTRPDHTGYLAPHSALVASLVTAYNEHLGLDNFKTHTIADPGNALASTADVAATVAAVKARLDDIVSKYNAHRVVIAGVVHAVADTVNVMTAVSPCTTEAHAITYYEHVYSVLLAHATETATYHVTSPSQGVGDGYLGWLAEPPTELQDVVDAINGAAGTRWASYGLTHLYEQHRQRSTVKVHAAAHSLGADTANAVLFLGDSQADLIVTANALAGALNRHVQNLDAGGVAAATPYHFSDAKRSRLVVGRASDVRSLAMLIEELWLCLESHLWSGGPVSGYTAVTASGPTRGQHPDRSFGGLATKQAPDARPFYLVRLQKAFDRALSPASASVPASLGDLPTYLQTRAGFA